MHGVGWQRALNHAFASLVRDRPLHKIHQDQGNHRRCNDDVAQPIEMPVEGCGIAIELDKRWFPRIPIQLVIPTLRTSLPSPATQ
jgi:hypothetical protein